MIVQPERYVETFQKAGADILTVHIEASPHLHRTIQHIRASGIKAGVALNPHTGVEQLKDIINDIDLVCLMSVNPGFGGQKFIENTYQKVKELKELISSQKANAQIEIDGGVNETNAPLLLKEGADVLVAGNFVFTSPHPGEVISRLKSIR
jgi:ribulose-phosphate 3-epimerase